MSSFHHLFLISSLFAGTKVRDTLRSNERNVSEKSITIPEPLQVEVAVPALPPVGVQGFNLHGEAGMGRETSAHSSWNGDHGPCPSVQETKQIDQRETTNPLSAEYAFPLYYFGLFGCTSSLVSLLREKGYLFVHRAK